MHPHTDPATSTVRRLLLRANAFYIGLAGVSGVVFDLRGAWLGVGPQGRILADAPYAAIGFVEAHGLAAILAVVLWRAIPARQWHMTAFAMDVLLGTSNLLFWQMFVAADALPVGYLTTALHLSFATAQLTAAVSAGQSTEATA